MTAQPLTRKDQLKQDLVEFIEYWEGEKPTKYVKTSTTPFSKGSTETIMFLAEEDGDSSDLGEKIKYDLETYDDNLQHKHNPKIAIKSWSFGFIDEDVE
jgi:hypothetical protein